VSKLGNTEVAVELVGLAAEFVGAVVASFGLAVESSESAVESSGLVGETSTTTLGTPLVSFSASIGISIPSSVSLGFS
jgi:hypothetical protein